MGLDVTGLAASVAMASAAAHAAAAAAAAAKPVAGAVSAGVPKQSSEISSSIVAAAQKVLQSQADQAKQATGVSLPAFYNPGVVNPMKYAEQIQKRKLLWGNKVIVLSMPSNIRLTNIQRF